jgi:hypothetical protein
MANNRSRGEQLASKYRLQEIIVPGRGLLYEQYSVYSETPISLSAHRASFFLAAPSSLRCSLVQRSRHL